MFDHKTLHVQVQRSAPTEGKHKGWKLRFGHNPVDGSSQLITTVAIYDQPSLGDAIQSAAKVARLRFAHMLQANTTNP